MAGAHSGSAGGEATPGVLPPTRVRVEAVDLLRGIIMILMALDHVRDFFTVPGVSPTDLATTTVALFFTRWVTHFCAPVFFFLTGTGAYLSRSRRSTRDLSMFLFTRGLWLIFVELFLLRCFGWQFNFDYQLTLIDVLWALGWAMMVLSVLVYLPASVVAALGAVMIAGHNLLDSVQSPSPLWSILHVPGVIVASPQHTVFEAYPLIPWIGVTAAGYGFGQVYRWPSDRRRAVLVRLGALLTVAFIAIRAINGYGDPSRWSAQPSAVFTALSFLNTTKYPPSLLYLLMTLGPAMLFLWAVDRRISRVLRPALVIGKVPMFYYMLHVVIIHLIAVAICYARYGAVHWMFESPSLDRFPITPPPGWGFPLPAIYLIWAVVVLLLYPLCRWFAAVKQRRSDPWLSYL